jgi:hypothetical protein
MVRMMIAEMDIGNFLLDEEEQKKEEEYQEIECEEQPVQNCDVFFEQVVESVVEKIDNFFATQQMHYGGPISTKMLHSPHYISRVLNTDISDGVCAAYAALGFPRQSEHFNEKQRKMFDKAQKLIETTLTNLAKSGIPKVYAGGILLMWLELVKGVEV